MIKLIKLVNGTEIIGIVVEQTKYTITVADVLQINYRHRNDMGPPSVALHRYNPFAGDKIFVFMGEHILNVNEPSEGLAKYYSAALKTIIETIDDTIEEELNYAARSFNDHTEEDLVREAVAEKMAYKPTLN